MLASQDVEWCAETSREAGVPEVSMQDGIRGAGRILKRRWRATLRLAYALASVGSMTGAELRPYLRADPQQALDAMDAYRAWVRETAHQWYETPEEQSA
jgi:hypothetical protein